ncbi:MAG TPA: HAMP domain-containing sensor histidine kinase [Longimicrobiales bacterium]|nr:HAMP domain-containing sensor histidine kinase [Longimicrobiales bacterium]
MSRRAWPAALAAVSIIVLASYLAYTQYLVREIQQKTEIDVEIFRIVQEAMLEIGEGGGSAENALLDLQAKLQELDVPIVVFNAAGRPYIAMNTPFGSNPNLNDPALQRQVLEYAALLRSRRVENTVSMPGSGEIIFGEPPILKWLRWVPYLQVGAGMLLLLIAIVILRADMRAHRERLWSAMARELAHQMGTPLSSLSGWVEVLQLDDAERSAMASPEKIGHLMHADVERLERVSRRFELIGKPQVLEVVALRDVVKELTSYFQPRLPHLAKGIVLRSRVARGLPAIRANRVLLVWALENIVKNAIDALAGRGGRISVLALARDETGGGRRKQYVHIVIADNGPGVAPSVRDRIFEPGVSTKSSGWGVGLSLSRRIVEDLHHGRITVQNRAGGGTVFDVKLPVART